MLILGILVPALRWLRIAAGFFLQTDSLLRSITAKDLQMSGASCPSIFLPRHNLLLCLCLCLSVVDIFLHTKMENKHAPRLQLIKQLFFKCLLLRQDAQHSPQFVRPPVFFLRTDTSSLYDKKLSPNSKRHSTIRCLVFSRASILSPSSLSARLSIEDDLSTEQWISLPILFFFSSSSTTWPSRRRTFYKQKQKVTR
jgi:hypothetical protein